MRMGIVDFHTHPFLFPENNYCFYKESYAMDEAQAYEYLTLLGKGSNCWERCTAGILPIPTLSPA